MCVGWNFYEIRSIMLRINSFDFEEVEKMFGNTIQMAHKALDYLWKKQEVTSANIANVDTPGYKKKSVSFEEVFKRRLAAASETNDNSKVQEAIEGTDYTVYSRDDSARVDENNVNIDVENSELARTTLHYQYLLQSVTGDVKRYQSAMRTQ